MSVGQWYVSRGRISRRTFWLRYFLPIMALSIVAGVLDLVLGFTDFRTTTAGSTTYSFSSSSGPIGGIVSLALLVPSISSQVTRLHDRGHSAWWLLFLLLPVIGWILLVVQTGFLRGEPQPNRYGSPVDGPQPLAEPGYPQSWS